MTKKALITGITGQDGSYLAEQSHVQISFDMPEYSGDVDALVGDPYKARRELGWEPKVKFADLVAMMVDADLELARRG